MIVPIFTLIVSLFKVLADHQLINTRRGLVLVFVGTTRRWRYGCSTPTRGRCRRSPRRPR